MPSCSVHAAAAAVPRRTGGLSPGRQLAMVQPGPCSNAAEDVDTEDVNGDTAPVAMRPRPVRYRERQLRFGRGPAAPTAERRAMEQVGGTAEEDPGPSEAMGGAPASLPAQ